MPHVDTGNFIVHVKLKSIDVDLARVVATRSNTSSYEGKRKERYPQEETKKGLMKDELGGKITKEFTALTHKTYSYLTDNGCVKNITNGTKKCVIKQEIEFEDQESV